jgi:hypothetical protein
MNFDRAAVGISRDNDSGMVCTLTYRRLSLDDDHRLGQVLALTPCGHEKKRKPG